MKSIYWFATKFASQILKGILQFLSSRVRQWLKFEKSTHDKYIKVGQCLRIFKSYVFSFWARSPSKIVFIEHKERVQKYTFCKSTTWNNPHAYSSYSSSVQLQKTYKNHNKCCQNSISNFIIFASHKIVWYCFFHFSRFLLPAKHQKHQLIHSATNAGHF